MASYLTGLARDYGTDKEGHLYCEHYEAHLGHLQHEAIRLCEIGVLAGASLLMWQAYFTEAEVIGVDKGRTLGGRDAFLREGEL
jgi:hypothetical protein